MNRKRYKLQPAGGMVQPNEPISFYVKKTRYKIQDYYKVKDVARLMNVTEKHVRNMINRGEIQAKRFGGAIRIPYSELVRNIKDYIDI